MGLAAEGLIPLKLLHSFSRGTPGFNGAWREVVVPALADVPCYNHKEFRHGILVPACRCHRRFVAHYELARVYAFVVPW